MHKITAEKIFDGTGQIHENKMLVVDNDGKILAIEDLPFDHGDIQKIRGWICPGFVNTHCHLELSHMKGKVDTGTGLIPFIKDVVTRRNVSPDDISQAIIEADKNMFNKGIVAVGDISNTKDTVIIKSKSKIRYYTFVEMFDFMQENLAQSTFEQYMEVFNSFDENSKNQKSVVPHAPYSVSKTLYQLINNVNNSDRTISIHNEETQDEISLFLNKKGGFPEFFGGFGFPLDQFEPTGKSPIFHVLTQLDPRHRTIFVHNTLTTGEGIKAAQKWSKNVYWATCPNANLYIENKLPNYQAFLHQNAKMTIGTDSLTSNWHLCIWEEIKTIHKYASYIPIETLITWATKNGAEALGFEEKLGTIKVGKSPAIVAIENNPDQQIQSSTSRRIEFG